MYHNNRRRSFRPRFQNNRKARFQGSKIDSSRYIKKATVTKQVVDEVSTQFADLTLDPRIQDVLVKRGFATPMPIQAKAIPHILAGADLIGIANTGTGKTGAFVIPLIQKILKDPDMRVLILVPTRELGVQIQDEIREFGQGMNIYSTLCIGGRYIRNQIYDLRRDPHFIIATPGRLKDLISQRAVDLGRIKAVVLDEADRMVDMGFIQDITHILSQLPSARQSLCFSATMSPQVATIVNKFLREPVSVSVKMQSASEQVNQDIVRVTGGAEKVVVLEELLRSADFRKVLIFSRTKHGAERLSVHLNSRGFRAIAIHGDKRQRQREQAISLFRENRCTILVATDVAARGIDIPDISHVINYDEPATYDDYIHRIGRTGRGDKTGHALTFV